MKRDGCLGRIVIGPQKIIPIPGPLGCSIAVNCFGSCCVTTVHWIKGHDHAQGVYRRVNNTDVVVE